MDEYQQIPAPNQSTRGLETPKKRVVNGGQSPTWLYPVQISDQMHGRPLKRIYLQYLPIPHCILVYPHEIPIK